MNADDLKIKVQNIVERASILKNKHTDNKNARVNYACIFSQSEDEYKDLLATTRGLGTIIEETPTGYLFRINPLETVAGVLRLLKIRIPDVTRPERGDADFTIPNYPAFKKKYLSREGFQLIKKREDFEMIELMDAQVRCTGVFFKSSSRSTTGMK